MLRANLESVEAHIFVAFLTENSYRKNLERICIGKHFILNTDNIV